MTPLLSFWHVFGIGNFVDPSHPTQVTGDHSQIKQIDQLSRQDWFWTFATEQWAELNFPIEEMDHFASEAAGAYVAQLEVEDEW